MRKLNLLLILISILTVSCGNTKTNDILVKNDKAINTTFTHESIIEVLGLPSSRDSLTTDSYGDVKTYHYGDDSFTFALEDGTMVDCLITSPTFKINGIAGVGDNISALSSAAAVKGNGDYYVIESDTHIITIYYENDIITKLTVSAKL